jgi:hypothetical protein
LNRLVIERALVPPITKKRPSADAADDLHLSEGQERADKNEGSGE